LFGQEKEDRMGLWELKVTRLEIQQNGNNSRAYGIYQAYLNGDPIAGLNGNVCEPPGAGENEFQASEADPRRIRKGRYPLCTQFGGTVYATTNYQGLDVPAGTPLMPGVLLGNTDRRTGIIIHPGHPPKLYLSSFGCLNLTKPLQAQQSMDFVESRSRVIAIIDSLASFAPHAFVQGQSMQIPDAWIDIDGALPDDPLPAAVA
jgi:hypothetical protein